MKYCSITLTPTLLSPRNMQLDLFDIEKEKIKFDIFNENKRIRMYSITINRSQKQWQIHNRFQYFTFINESSSIILTMLIFYSKLKILLNNHQKKKKRKTFTLHIYITIISIKNHHVAVSKRKKNLLSHYLHWKTNFEFKKIAKRKYKT